MRRFKEAHKGLVLDEKGEYLYVPQVIAFLEDLEKDQNIHVVMNKIRLMKEHLK